MQRNFRIVVLAHLTFRSMDPARVVRLMTGWSVPAQYTTLHLPTACERAHARAAQEPLVLDMVLRLRAFDDHVGHDIPRVANAHDHEHQL